MERPAWVVRQLASKIQSRSYTIAGLDIPAKKQKYVPSAGTFPLGFQVAGVNVGVKPSNTTKPDIALINSDRPCAAAAVFTKNKFQAAPVTFSRDLLKRTNNKIQSVIINSGCANAVTGKGGLEDAVQMSQETDKVTGASDSTIVMSTGVIGQRYKLSLTWPPSLRSQPSPVTLGSKDCLSLPCPY
jgi:glutamate N-acetyltransferase/amino-acid N-acetyltransferase